MSTTVFNIIRFSNNIRIRGRHFGQSGHPCAEYFCICSPDSQLSTFLAFHFQLPRSGLPHSGHLLLFPHSGGETTAIRPIRPILSSPVARPRTIRTARTASTGCRLFIVFALSIRQRKCWRRDARWNLELSRFPPANKKLFPLLATGGSPGVIQRRGVGRRNGEIKNAATESGVPGFSFTPFMFFMVKCIWLPSVCSASSVVKLYWLFFVNFRAFRGKKGFLRVLDSLSGETGF